jgi:NAD(P)-dependent dehydrogenase (short-subunit alcohol dehydrogenase family)
MTTEQKPLGSGFGAQTTGEEALGGRDLRGKVALVTGGHSGIGLETTRVLSKAGAAVVVGARDVERARANLAKIGNAEVLPLDLASPSSIDSFADAFLKSRRPLDILDHTRGTSSTTGRTTKREPHTLRRIHTGAERAIRMRPAFRRGRLSRTVRSDKASR